MINRFQTIPIFDLDNVPTQNAMPQRRLHGKGILSIRPESLVLLSESRRTRIHFPLAAKPGSALRASLASPSCRHRRKRCRVSSDRYPKLDLPLPAGLVEEPTPGRIRKTPSGYVRFPMPGSLLLKLRKPLRLSKLIPSNP